MLPVVVVLNLGCASELFRSFEHTHSWILPYARRKFQENAFKQIAPCFNHQVVDLGRDSLLILLNGGIHFCIPDTRAVVPYSGALLLWIRAPFHVNQLLFDSALFGLDRSTTVILKL